MGRTRALEAGPIFPLPFISRVSYCVVIATYSHAFFPYKIEPELAYDSQTVNKSRQARKEGVLWHRRRHASTDAPSGPFRTERGDDRDTHFLKKPADVQLGGVARYGL
jgi:hypothetical protein